MGEAQGSSKEWRLDGDRQGWLVSVDKISVFGMGSVKKAVQYCGKILAIPTVPHPIRLHPGLEPQSRPSKATRTSSAPGESPEFTTASFVAKIAYIHNRYGTAQTGKQSLTRTVHGWPATQP